MGARRTGYASRRSQSSSPLSSRTPARCSSKARHTSASSAKTTQKTYAKRLSHARGGSALIEAERASLRERLIRYERAVKALREDLVAGNIVQDTYEKRLRDLLRGR